MIESILINQINLFNNTIIQFTNKKIKPIKTMIKGYFDIYKVNISDFLKLNIK